MREEIANLVFPVLTHGIRLKERLASADPPEFGTAQKELQGLLQATHQAKGWAEFAGDRGAGESQRGDSVRPARSDFLGIRYALVCWLDEIFIMDSPWKDQWTEQSLERDLYDSRDRAWKFWEQADKAGTRLTTDALEVYYLCVMLGFRGDKGTNLEELKAWCERVKAQIDQGQEQAFTGPMEGQPRTYVPVLSGAARLHTMVIVAGAVLFPLVLVLAFLVVFYFRNR